MNNSAKHDKVVHNVGQEISAAHSASRQKQSAHSAVQQNQQVGSAAQQNQQVGSVAQQNPAAHNADQTNPASLTYTQEKHTAKQNMFEKYLAQEFETIGKLVKEDRQHGSHPDMNTYLYDPLAKFCENGGKRHRPIICALACMAVGGTKEQANTAGLAIEYFHLAALMHDDIADDSLTRHNKPCMHITEGIPIALNVGDFALTHVTGLVLNDEKLSDAVKVRVLKQLTNMTYRTIEGQALDLGWVRDKRFDVSVDDYLVMAKHKTAFYSAGIPLAVGGIVGGGTQQQIDALYNYGMSCGLAFQLQDDLLNLVGEKDKVGKDFRSDITEGKRTLAAVYALENAPCAEHDELVEILSSKTKDEIKLERAVCIMEKTGALDYVREYALKLSNSQKTALLNAFEPNFALEYLLSMADFFISRLK